MIQCKKQDIDAVVNEYASMVKLKVRGVTFLDLVGERPRYEAIAEYQPNNADWPYQIGILIHAGNAYKGVFRDGVCKAIVPLDIV